MAWGVLLVSFATLCLLVAGVILAVHLYMTTATDAQEAHLTVVRGTVLIQQSRRFDWVAASDNMALSEGYRIRTDDASQALLTLMDGTQVNIFPGSEVSISYLRRLRFDKLSFGMTLNYSKGMVRIDIADSNVYKRDFRVSVPAASALASLMDGSYSIDSTDGVAEIKVRDGGWATVSAQDREVEVHSGQRTQLAEGQPPTPPVAAAEEMTVNGRFQEGLARWAWGNRDTAPKSSQGNVEIVSTELGNAVRFSRTDSNATHGETFIHQDINQDVADFRSLHLFLQLKLVNQSLSGGGYMGSEYPLMVKIYYRTDRGDTALVYGFYYQNDADNLTYDGTLLPQNEWVSYTIPQNLMAVDPPPVRILSVEVTASGHDYESLLKEVSLEGE